MYQNCTNFAFCSPLFTMVYLKSRGKTRTLMMRLFFISSLILHGLNWPWKIIISQKFFKISKWFYSTHFRQLHSLEQYQIRFRDAWYMGHVTGEFRISELFLGLNRGWNVKNGPKWFFLALFWLPLWHKCNFHKNEHMAGPL